VSNSLLQIPVDELMPDPNQPRQGWVQSEIDRLATSITARGILQPLRVVRDNERKCWRIVTGESRWRAAKQAGLATVPCVPVEGVLDETDMLAEQIVENHCRHDPPAFPFVVPHHPQRLQDAACGDGRCQPVDFRLHPPLPGLVRIGHQFIDRNLQ